MPLATIEPVRAPEPEVRVKAASADEVISAYLSLAAQGRLRRPRRTRRCGAGGDREDVPVPGREVSPIALRRESARCVARESAGGVPAVARAYAQLADPTQRATLLARREKLREEAAAAAKAGPSAMIDPEALYRSAQNLAAAGKLREALSSFELAAECDAQNGTYAAEAAWTRHRLGNTPASAAMKMLKNAIRIDPNSGLAYLYAGQVQAALGRKVEASAYLDRARTLMPGDPRPASAAKTLRL